MGLVHRPQGSGEQMPEPVTMGDRKHALCSSMPGARTTWEQACGCSKQLPALWSGRPWAHLSTHCSSNPASSPGALTPSQASSCSWQAASAAAHTSASSATRCRGSSGCPALCLPARPASALSPSLAAAKLCSLVGCGTWRPGVRRVTATPMSGMGNSSVDSCEAEIACLHMARQSSDREPSVALRGEPQPRNAGDVQPTANLRQLSTATCTVTAGSCGSMQALT